MRTTNKRRYESLKHLLALCEQYKEPLEAMPLGKAFLDQLRESVRKGADYFQSEAGGRNAAHEATVARGEQAVIVRQQANKLRRAARVLGPKTGVTMELPPLRETSDQQRSAIINLHAVEGMETDVDGGMTVALEGGPSVKVSRRQSRRLRDELSL